MSKSAVIYWSGTGNTEAMAQAVLDGLNGAGEGRCAFSVIAFVPQMRRNTINWRWAVLQWAPRCWKKVCSSRSLPSLNLCSPAKKSPFGSYGWGDGQWMHDWQDRCAAAGAVLCGEGLTVNEAPDDIALAECTALGKALSLLRWPARKHRAMTNAGTRLPLPGDERGACPPFAYPFHPILLLW